MEKRLILAIALSLFIIISWSALTNKFYPVENKAVMQQASVPVLTNTQLSPTKAASFYSEEAVKPESLFTLPLKQWKVIFIEPRAAVKETIFSSYLSYVFSLKYGFLLGDPGLIFKKTADSENGVQFICEDSQKRIIKEFTFSNSSYAIGLTIRIDNLSDKPMDINLPLVVGVLDFKRDPVQARYQDVVVALPEKTLRLNGKKDESFNSIKFVGLRDRYICLIVEPQSAGWSGFIKKINNSESELGLVNNVPPLAPGQIKQYNFRIYLGPQDLKHINLVKSEWAAMVNYGVFDFIAQVILQILEILYSIVHNWGWAIIILSILIYLLLFPLTLKQMRSMKNMQALQPEIEELRKAYKNNPQKLNKEIMELYRKNKANPLAGCLPLILQMPIFIALYQVLMRSASLKGATFLWIKDLSGPDRLFLLPFSIPILGNELNILPILMAIGMFVQQRFSMVATAGSSAEQQKMMMILMPLMFGFIFYHMPAGLVLYWFVNSLFMLSYQIHMNRIK